MNILETLTKTATVAAALALLAAAPAGAQVRRPGDAAPAPAASSFTRNANQRLIDDALREFGYNPVRLRVEEQEEIDDAWAQIVPDANPRRYRLNRSQALAIVYLALVYPRGGGRGPGREPDWEDEDDDGRRPGRPGGGGVARECREINTATYEILNVATSTGGSIFVEDDEKERLRRAAREVQRLAVQRGWHNVAERASQVIAAVSGMMPNKTLEVAPPARALRAAVEQACPPEGYGRGR